MSAARSAQAEARPTRLRRVPTKAGLRYINRELSLARLERAGPLPGQGSAEPAPRAGEVPGDLRQQPRRVLPGPRRRPPPAGRRALGPPVARRPVRRGAARADPVGRPPSRGRALGRARRDPQGPRRGRDLDRQVQQDPAAPRPAARAVHRGDLPGPHAARGRPRATRSRTSARSACRSPSGCAIRRSGERRFARVKVPPVLPRLIEVEPNTWVLLDQVISNNLDLLFTGMEITDAHLFRVTRNADLAIEEDEAERPAPGDRGGAPPAPLRRGRPARGRAEHAGGDPADPARRDPPGRGGLLRGQRDARPHRPVDDRRARPPRPPAAVVDAGRAAPPRPARRGRAGRRLRRDPGGRHLPPSPVRVVHRVGRAVHRPGRRGPRGPHDQADALPDVGRLADRARPHPGRRARQAGRRARRDQGPLRRGGEHRLGAQARAGRRPRRVRARRAQDPLEGGPRRPARGIGPAPLRPHRDRQLQPADGPPVRRPRAADLPAGARRRRDRPVQRPDRPVPPARLPAAARRAATACDRGSSA